MKRPASLAGKLAANLLAGLALAWLVGAAISIVIVRQQLENSLDGGLRETAERILPLVSDAIADADAGQAEAYPDGLIDAEGGEYVVYQVRNSAGAVLLRSHDAPEIPFVAPLAAGFANVPPWRVYTTGIGDLYVQVAEGEARRAGAVWQAALAMALPLALFLPLAAVIILVAVRSGLAPLRDLGREVAARDGGNLEPLPAVPVAAELAPVRAAINALLGRLRSALEAERALAASSAHEMRTPIAGSLAQTQRLVEELQGHPAQARAGQVEDLLHRLSALTSKLLALSRAEAGMARSAAPIDLLPALKLMLADTSRSLGDRLTLTIAPGAQLVAPLDLDAFGIVVRNLIENAERHGLRGGRIAVSVGNGELSVSNDGDIVPADRLPMLTRRFERGGSQAAGSGLGLAIVQTIVSQVDGRLELHSPAPGMTGGFTARVVRQEVRT